ncbi:hypothetical protein C5167_018711 [Papaver somniferum]|uniref:Uncharacterized protein n=1 Tax=Papaver somniferum TaxID=3469 RepID=A0A4Y7IS77_PAPSO|nr:hypothetical protein C5167_018711 [Papaver somniferum]
MYLKYYSNDNGDEVYTIKSVIHVARDLPRAKLSDFTEGCQGKALKRPLRSHKCAKIAREKVLTVDIEMCTFTVITHVLKALSFVYRYYCLTVVISKTT